MVVGLRQEVGVWMLRHLPEITVLPGGYEAIGVARGDVLVGGCLYSDFKAYRGGGDIQVWAVGRDWLSRRTIREMLGYPFNQLGCHRLTAVIGRKNKASRRLVEDLGFKLEGVARQGLGLGRDACIYGLLKGEAARWIDGTHA